MWNDLTKLIENYQSLALEEHLDYEKFSMMSIVWHSTKIEGCSLTETETKVLLEQNITSGGKPLTDHVMVKDHYDAFLFIKEEAFRKRKFTIEFIQKLNVTAIIGRVQLEAFCKAVNTRLDEVKGTDITKLAADVHYNFVNIHPFVDGNGRTARLLMNYILLYHNQPLLKFFTEDRVAYIDALNETEEKKNLEVFRAFTAEQYSKFLTLEIDKHQTLKNKRFMMMF